MDVVCGRTKVHFLMDSEHAATTLSSHLFLSDFFNVIIVFFACHSDNLKDTQMIRDDAWWKIEWFSYLHIWGHDWFLPLTDEGGAHRELRAHLTLRMVRTISTAQLHNILLTITVFYILIAYGWWLRVRLIVLVIRPWRPHVLAKIGRSLILSKRIMLLRRIVWLALQIGFAACHLNLIIVCHYLIGKALQVFTTLWRWTKFPISWLWLFLISWRQFFLLVFEWCIRMFIVTGYQQHTIQRYFFFLSSHLTPYRALAPLLTLLTFNRE